MLFDKKNCSFSCYFELYSFYVKVICWPGLTTTFPGNATITEVGFNCRIKRGMETQRLELGCKAPIPDAIVWLIPWCAHSKLTQNSELSMYAPRDFIWISWPNLVWTVIKVWQDVSKIVAVLFLPYKKSKQQYSVNFDPIPTF